MLAGPRGEWAQEKTLRTTRGHVTVGEICVVIQKRR